MESFEVPEVPSHSLETLAFRSYKRGRDMFLSSYGKPLTPTEEAYVCDLA
jgi:hypothetical protein